MMASAVWFPRARTVEVRDEELRAPGSHEIRVRAILSALSHGTEMLVYRGEVTEALPLDLATLAGSYSFPVKYGYASVGRAVAIGAAVTRIKDGDLVFALHPHQDEYVVPEELACPLPSGLSPEVGVFLANLDTALNVVLDAHPRLGETVAVFGQGVVGLLLTQLLHRAGARVIAVEPTPLRRAFAERCGAIAVIASGEATRVRSLTNGRGADLAIEASGSAAALQGAIDCVAVGATVVVCSWYGTKPVPLDLGGRFHRGRVQIRSSQVGDIDGALRPRWGRERRLALATDLLPELQLTELITHRFPFARAAEAYALLDERPAETVQVVLEYA